MEGEGESEKEGGRVTGSKREDTIANVQFLFAVKVDDGEGGLLPLFFSNLLLSISFFSVFIYQSGLVYFLFASPLGAGY